MRYDTLTYNGEGIPGIYGEIAKLTNLVEIDVSSNYTSGEKSECSYLMLAYRGRNWIVAHKNIVYSTADFEELNNLTALSCLDLSNNGIRDWDLAKLTALRRVQELSIRNLGTQSGLGDLIGMGELQALSVFQSLASLDVSYSW